MSRGTLGQAVAWFRKAADQGDASAQFTLGRMFATGTGVERDPAQMVQWFRKAAEKGHADAQFSLALLYANGTGVAKDDALAVEWYRKAADPRIGGSADQSGNADTPSAGACHRMRRQAVEWFRLAADQGDASAQFNLGVMYANGTGVGQDSIDARSG